MRLHFELLNHVLTESREHPLLVQRGSVEKARSSRRAEAIRRGFVRDRNGGSGPAGTP